MVTEAWCRTVQPTAGTEKTQDEMVLIRHILYHDVHDRDVTLDLKSFGTPIRPEFRAD